MTNHVFGDDDPTISCMQESLTPLAGLFRHGYLSLSLLYRKVPDGKRCPADVRFLLRTRALWPKWLEMVCRFDPFDVSGMSEAAKASFRDSGESTIWSVVLGCACIGHCGVSELSE